MNDEERRQKTRRKMEVIFDLVLRLPDHKFYQFIRPLAAYAD